ncbi:N-acetyltransferase [Blastococcus sp. URHD0036]|uniref:GNAT family N-acetyltransferase n=1 Tax=Blastococcus sp. URHD0036 TaxID=1380356 RepID=UPI0004984D1F|nr:GNAT family N-acetyltransferase [Blastococcus sp. URHD0036]
MNLSPLDPAGDGSLASDLLALQREAYAVEAALLGDDRIPPLHESLAALRAAPLRWTGAWGDGGLTGAVAWTDDGDLVDVHRLVVAPRAARQGIGSALIRSVLALGRRTVVATGRDNAPARALYERLGFVPTGDREVLPGLWVTGFRHDP